MGSFYKSYNTAFDLHIPASKLGAPTSPMVAKQLEEVGKRLNEGVKNIEIGTISADKFEMIPRQHFDEIRRISKLTDAKISVHAPLVDLAGFPTGEGGGRWREEQRASTEQQVFSILERSHQLSNGENVPVVFHAGHTFSQEYGIPYDAKKHPEGLYKEEYEKDSGGKVKLDKNNEPIKKKVPINIRAIAAVNQDTGEMIRLDYEKKHHLGTKGEEVYDPYRRLEALNETQWDKDKVKLLNYQKEIEDLKEKMTIKMKQNEALKKTGLAATNEDYKRMAEINQMDVERMHRHINEINRELRSEYNEIYGKFVKFAPEKERKEFQEELKNMTKNFSGIQGEIEKRYAAAKMIENEARRIKDDEERMQFLQEKSMQKIQNELFDLQVLQSKQVVTDIANMPTPKLWRPVGEFAIEKTAETVAGAVAKMYEKLKKDGREKETPFIAMENFFTHSPMSTGKDLKKAVEEGRKKLAEELKTRCNLSTEKANKEAEKLIGATWDVGHINNLRKAGYEGEELKQKVIEETKDVADVVRHVHITDNFGFFDSHLPPGMGNVPIREIMEQLEKKWAQLEKEGKLPQTPRGIVEAGGFVAEIGQNPQVGVLEYFGSPLYKIGPTPYFWGGPKSVGFSYSPYTESFIEFPSQHFSLYGSSFTTLPKTVGGQVGEEKSRFSGTPNQ